MSTYTVAGKILTDTISPDEPCYGLLEADRVVLLGAQGSAWHRVQDVFVVRGDEIAAYQTDLGPVEDFAGVPPVGMLSMGDDKVGELMAEAERSRADPYYPALQRELIESSTLLKDFVDQREQNWKLIRNQSVFGPGVTRQRNGFPYQEIHEQAKAKGRLA